jgi:hypothetical protein
VPNLHLSLLNSVGEEQIGLAGPEPLQVVNNPEVDAKAAVQSGVAPEEGEPIRSHHQSQNYYLWEVTQSESGLLDGLPAVGVAGVMLGRIEMAVEDRQR